MKALWFIVWLIILLVFSFWIAGFLAFVYIILYPITVCIPALSVSSNFVRGLGRLLTVSHFCLQPVTDFLLKCIQFPKYCAENMMAGNPLF